MSAFRSFMIYHTAEPWQCQVRGRDACVEKSGFICFICFIGFTLSVYRAFRYLPLVT